MRGGRKIARGQRRNASEIGIALRMPNARAA